MIWEGAETYDEGITESFLCHKRAGLYVSDPQVAYRHYRGEREIKTVTYIVQCIAGVRFCDTLHNVVLGYALILMGWQLDLIMWYSSSSSIGARKLWINNARSFQSIPTFLICKSDVCFEGRSGVSPEHGRMCLESVMNLLCCQVYIRTGKLLKGEANFQIYYILM